MLTGISIFVGILGCLIVGTTLSRLFLLGAKGGADSPDSEIADQLARERYEVLVQQLTRGFVLLTASLLTFAVRVEWEQRAYEWKLDQETRFMQKQKELRSLTDPASHIPSHGTSSGGGDSW